MVFYLFQPVDDKYVHAGYRCQEQANVLLDAGGRKYVALQPVLKEAVPDEHTSGLAAVGYMVPLVADAFQSGAADVAAQYVEKVRINPVV